QQEGFKIVHLCKALKVSRAGYYKWLNRKPSPKGQRLEKLIEMIVHTYNKFNGIYGYRRITIYLNHYLGAKVNHK
ncbi:IS3 family transposase, partial [Aerococcus viridans]